MATALDPHSADFLVLAAEHVGAAYPDLFPHQRNGVAFLLSRRKAILADDMGLGKTRTAVVAAREQHPDGPYLVMCPATLKLNWQREIHMVEPGAHVQVLGTEPVDPTARWVVVNYDRLGRFSDQLADAGFAVIVLDEAHYIKNRSQRTARVNEILAGNASDAVYLLTGTPMTNRPRDLFQLLKAIDHPVARSFYKFARTYCGAYDNGYGLDTNGASNLDDLSLVIAGVMLRRAKSDVLDLPEKVRTWLPVDTPIKRVKSDERRALDYLAANPARDGATWFTFLGLMNKARHTLAVAKATPTADHVGDIVEAGNKVVVFTGYTAVVNTLLERFGAAAVSITGDTPTDARQVAIDRFQADPSVRVLVGNLHAAGVGITLTAATHVVFNDLDWVPANHWQAEDRIHRIGQTRTTFATYMYAPDTLDAFVAELLETKAQLVAEVEQASIEQSSLLETVVELALRGDQPMPSAVTMPLPPTMGLAERTIDTLEQFGGPKESGVRVHRFGSKSNRHVVYEVVVDNGTATCDCPGFNYGDTCWHVKAALRGDLSKALPD